LRRLAPPRDWGIPDREAGKPFFHFGFSFQEFFCRGYLMDVIEKGLANEPD
jgi:hypothetical protein